jgi:GntR family transcriptional repressor for pyruvate dehydrogenase complex
VTDDAITRIRQMILTGELAPGDRLSPEGNLAANLGLSRTSLREAVRALTVLGVIDTRQGDASYITSLGPELLLGALGLMVDLQREDAMPDLVAVRRILEPAARLWPPAGSPSMRFSDCAPSSRQGSTTSK